MTSDMKNSNENSDVNKFDLKIISIIIKKNETPHKYDVPAV